MTRTHRRVTTIEVSAGSVLPPTAQLLTEGGDARIALDSALAINQYGCPAVPDPALLAFGSSTASVISAHGFDAADRLRVRLQHAISSDTAEAIYARELERVRGDLRQLCGIVDADIVFATSGTDLHLIAAQLVASDIAGDVEKPPLIVSIEATETGSQVPTALRGMHFGTGGHELAEEGHVIEAAVPCEIASIAVREANGEPRPAATVDAEVAAQVTRGVAEGRHVLLILVDVSKSGLLAPSPSCAIALRQCYSGQLDVMIDACQFRLAAATLHAYLDQGFMVALTGSKFMSGPTFSGALLLPQVRVAQLRGRPLPAALHDYSTRAEWPAGWDVAELPEHANFGLLLRWEAALAEMRAFCAVPESTVKRTLNAFADAVRQRLDDDPLLEAITVPPLNRHGLIDASGWDECQTIFPFLLRRPDGCYLSLAETTMIYRLLSQGADGLRCQLGQPVSCGRRGGQPVAALRLCHSARLAVEAAFNAEAAAIVIARAMRALDQVVMRVRVLPRS